MRSHSETVKHVAIKGIDPIAMAPNDGRFKPKCRIFAVTAQESPPPPCEHVRRRNTGGHSRHRVRETRHGSGVRSPWLVLGSPRGLLWPRRPAFSLLPW